MGWWLIGGVSVALVVGVFFLAPVVYSPTTPPDQLAFLGPLPGYKSLSCATFGVGTGLWRAYSSYPDSNGYIAWSWEWSYHLSCAPLS